MWHWFLWVTGSSNVSGKWYGFWSGFAGDIPMFLGVGVLWRKVNCHEPRCPRIGTHHVPGTHYVKCRKHHPLEG